MLWLVAIAALGVAAATPLLCSGSRPAHRRRRLGKWLLVGVWAWCAVAFLGYVTLLREFGCWREDSVLGDERWTLVPFGQVCTFRATDHRPAEVTRPGWAPTFFLVVTFVGAAVIATRLSVNARRRTSRSVHSQTAG
ncbi:MAG: hypothetical protein RL238_420 [Actinomycetota bacterium]|jgi:hypothetical protein